MVAVQTPRTGDVGEGEKKKKRKEKGKKRKESKRSRSANNRRRCHRHANATGHEENGVEGESLEWQVDVGRDGVFLWI